MRRRGRNIFLRASLPSPHPYVDTENAAERAWWECAYPFSSPLEHQEMAKAARRGTKAPRAAARPAHPAALAAEENSRNPLVTLRQGAAPGAPLVPALGRKS
jgi:hypothetical protein